MRAPILAPLALLSMISACAGEGPPGELVIDARCEALCVDSETDASCDLGVTRCELECSARVEGLSSLCSACLVERAGRGGTPCLPGEVCCAGGVDFPSDVFDCATSCASDVGPPVRDPDPRCEALCGTIDAGGCGAVRSECYASCQSRIRDASGLCATCLLEGAGVSGTPCFPGEPCCPSGLDFGTSVEECAAICTR